MGSEPREFEESEIRAAALKKHDISVEKGRGIPQPMNEHSFGHKRSEGCKDENNPKTPKSTQVVGILAHMVLDK